MDPKTLRESIFAIDDRPLTSVDVPEWNVTLFVRPMSVSQRLRMSDEFDKLDSNGRLARLISESVCVQSGELVFSKDDAEKIVAKAYKPVKTLVAVIKSINGISDDDADDAKKD